MLSTLKKQLLKLWAAPSKKEQLEAAGQQGTRFYLGASALRNAAFALLALVATAGLVWGAYALYTGGRATALYYTGGEGPRTAEVEAPMRENGEVPIASVDSGGEPAETEYIRTRDAQGVEGALAAPGGRPAALLRRDPCWLPELQPPGSCGLGVELLGDSAQTAGITYTPRPRAFLAFEPRPLLGGGVLADTAASFSPYAGIDLGRVGPLHPTLGVVRTEDGALNLAPGGGLMLRRGLMVHGAWVPGTPYPYAGLSYRF